jgi:putative SOS response-associated peptidase YedK
MCGRFVSASPPDELARYFDVDQVAEQVLEPSFNVAPTSDVYVIVETGGVRRLDTFHWGLIPFWAKDRKVGQKMINARAETLADKSAYRRAFQKRRCIIPADGFFEWKKVPGQKAKQPMYIHRNDGEPMAFAGLWEVWRPGSPAESGAGDAGTPDDESTWVHSCTIITGDPNEVVSPIHDRMPVQLPPSAWDTWLSREVEDTELLGKLLVPAPAALLAAHPVSLRVNDVRQNDSALVDPFDPDGGQATLL